MTRKSLQLTTVIEREDNWFVATCPEVEVVSQGKTIEEARSNLLEAVEGFFEVASPSEIRCRLKVAWACLTHACTGCLRWLLLVSKCASQILAIQPQLSPWCNPCRLI